jgi:hypothetical protein
MLVDCLGRGAELLSLLFCDLGGGLVSLPASQQVDPTSGRLLGRALDLEALDLANLFNLYHEHVREIYVEFAAWISPTQRQTSTHLIYFTVTLDITPVLVGFARIAFRHSYYPVRRR